MKLLGIDLETSGLEPKSERITEVGLVLWDTDGVEPVLFESILVKPDLQKQYPPIPQEIVELTGIDDNLVNQFGVYPYQALERIRQMAKKCDYFVAHNAEFEMKFISALIEDLEDEPGEYACIETRPWVDTKIHVPYPASIGPRDLVSLCAHHKFFNPHPHRAMWDAWAMMQILIQYNDTLDSILENVTAPKVKLWSVGITFKTKELPKSLSYYWDNEARRWWTIVKESELDDAIGKAKQKGFEVEPERLPVYSTISQLKGVC